MVAWFFADAGTGFSIKRNLSRLSITLLGVSGLWLWGCQGEDGAASPQQEVAVYWPRVITTLAHDTAAFTQGLFYHDGTLYESTGLYGHSSLRAIDTTSGKILKKISIPHVFAEGCACRNDTLTLLTWKSRSAYRFRLDDFSRVGTFSYQGEGWGLTVAGQYYLMSNGSAEIVWRDHSFAEQRRCTVQLEGRPLARLNELEWVSSSLFANIWMCDSICEIDPGNGQVIGLYDCSSLAEPERGPGGENVLNGIAFVPHDQTFFITGKRWKSIYRVVWVPRGADG